MRSRSRSKGLTARAFALVILFACLSAGDVSGQERYWGALNFDASREVLGEALSRFDNTALSQAYSAELRAQARARATEIRTRLQEGDFQVGDRFLLTVEGDSILTDTFTIGVGRAVYLPNIGDISLQGVLNSELQDHVTRELGRFLADPIIRARPMARIGVFGAVAEPGYYRVPIETPITDVIMLVGGPNEDAKMGEAYLDRYGERIWLGEALQTALREGETLDEIKMLPGDEVFVPARPALSITQILGILTGTTGVVFTLLSI